MAHFLINSGPRVKQSLHTLVGWPASFLKPALPVYPGVPWASALNWGLVLLEWRGQ